MGDTLVEPDFSGWATKPDIKCSDGRTIMHGAFDHHDNEKVPLVWSHKHNSPENVLGHAILKKKDGGIRVDAYFNDTAPGKHSKEMLIHGDIEDLSIWANELIEKMVKGGKQVFHGAIREVSLVLAGANPGAKIDFVRLAHSDDPDDFTELADTAIITSGMGIEIMHSGVEEKQEQKVEELAHEDGKTVKEVFDSMNDEQQEVVLHMVQEALDTTAGGEAEQGQTNNNEGDLTHQEGNTDMGLNRNLFENNEGTEQGQGTDSLAHGSMSGSGMSPQKVLSHDQIRTIWEDMKKPGMTFKEAVLAHADEYGIGNINLLFPDAQAVDRAPQLVSRRQEWVSVVIDGTNKLPYARIKSLSADITHDEARAKGYIKATMKKNEFFELAKRETYPKTIYKKQQLDRDDIIDVADFDIVTWLWGEMRLMLMEEIARAILIGDGREIDDPDKVDEDKIRPIAQDDNFYAHQVVLTAATGTDAQLDEMILAREHYRGLGNPVLFATETWVSRALLIRDDNLRKIYPTMAELQATLRVSKIVEVPVMAGAQTENGDLIAIMVNLSDYSVGSDKGGKISTFDDFDIDWNQYKYLIEGRMSGALTKYKTALVFSKSTASGKVTPDIPTFNAGTGVVTIPTKTGVVYKNTETGVVLSSGAQSAIAAGASVEIEAVPAAGYYFPHNFDADWVFTRTA